MSSGSSPRLRSPLRTASPVRSPLRTASPVRSPLRTASPVRSPLRSASPVRTPLRSNGGVTMTRKSLSPALASNGSVGGDEARQIAIATGSIPDSKFKEMCNSSPEMKSACRTGLLGERSSSIKLKERTGVSSFKSSVAQSMLRTGTEEFAEYAAALDDAGFRSLTKDPELRDAVLSIPLLSVRHDLLEGKQEYTSSRSPSKSPLRSATTPMGSRSRSPLRGANTRRTPETTPLTLNKTKDAQSLSVFSPAELSDIVEDDSYVKSVVNSTAFTKARTARANRSSWLDHDDDFALHCTYKRR